MAVVTEQISLQTKGKDEVIDVTPKVVEAVGNAQIENGLVTVFVPGSTASVTTVEYEPGLVKDIKVLGERLAPKNLDYAHNETWGDGNGCSHVRAAVIGPSLSVPLVEGDLALGTWQQIVVIDHDTRSRSREVVIQIIGE